MSSGPEVSVVVSARDRADRLAGLLRSLGKQTLDAQRFEVVIVDNGSLDDTPSVLQREQRRGELRLKALSLPRGGGPARARNAGWRTAKSPLVAFTDDDCEPTADWLEQVLATSAKHPGAIIQGPTTPIPRELRLTGPFTRTRVIVRPNPSFQTCNIVYSRAVLEALGGFDEESFAREAGGEDTDLGWRARKLGTELHWCDRVRVHHAVDDVGPVGLLRGALRDADAALVFRRHPELRAELRWGVARNARLAWLALALAGVAIGRRSPPLGALLALPYVRHLGRVCRTQRANFLLAPYYVLRDFLLLYTALRGSLRHGTFVM